MLASGDWLVPQLAGVPHLDKPPLTYWAAALGFRVLGVTPFAGRLLEQLALLATALLVFAFCRVRIGATAAWSAAGILLTSGLVFGSSRGLNTDLFQLLFLTAGLLALYEASRGGAGAAVLGLALLGVSMLVKGPIALLVALSVAIPFLVLRARRALALGARLPDRRGPVRGDRLALVRAPGAERSGAAALVRRAPDPRPRVWRERGTPARRLLPPRPRARWVRCPGRRSRCSRSGGCARSARSPRPRSTCSCCSGRSFRACSSSCSPPSSPPTCCRPSRPSLWRSPARRRVGCSRTPAAARRSRCR